MTPQQLADKGSEAHSQQALFLWSSVAERYGWTAAEDQASYTTRGHLQRVYGVNPREVPTPSGKAMSWVDDGGKESVPELRWLHAIPNGGRRDGFTGALMKAEGVKRGVVDIFLPLPMRRKNSYGEPLPPYHGLYVEMKRAKSKGKAAGTLSDEQTEFVAYARRVGYAVAVCFDWIAAKDQIRSYIEECRKGY